MSGVCVCSVCLVYVCVVFTCALCVRVERCFYNMLAPSCGEPHSIGIGTGLADDQVGLVRIKPSVPPG